MNAPDRLSGWKRLRNSMNGMSITDALDKCSDFWNTAPFTPFYLDYQNVEKWPNPWELLTENCYCDIARALGIIYTIHLCEHGKQFDIKLRVYIDNVGTGYYYNLVWINDGQYILNLFDETISKDDINNMTLLTEFSKCDLRLDDF